MVSVSGDLELVFVFSVLLLVGVMSMVELKHLIKSLKEEEIKKKNRSDFETKSAFKKLLGLGF